MRYAEALQPLENGGMLETRQFTIAATGKAFRNLMDGLYSRKIEAFCREILTNAYDSHCERGQHDRLFDVRLPTIFDKRLKVRDYGVGMTHDQVMERYSTLFDSTKDDSDEFVGMLGLGSKSPFAYTDGFSLRCWDGEEVRVYAVNLGPGGVPQVSLAGRFPSTDEQGVEITIPVAREDWTELERAMARVCLGFSNPPTLPLVVRQQMKWDTTVSGKGWAAGACELLTPGFWARQGCVIYPIERAEVLRVFPEWGRDTKLRVVVDFELGELDVATSREQISLTDKSRENIRKRLTAVAEELTEELSVEFSDCKTDWEIALRYEKLGVKAIPPAMLENTDFRKIHFRIKEELSETLRSYRHRGKAYRWAMISLSSYDGGHERFSGDLQYWSVNQSDSYRVAKPKIPNDENAMILVVDASNNNARIAHHLERIGKKKALVLRVKNDGGLPCVWKHAITEDQVSKYPKEITEDDLLTMPVIRKLGFPEMIRASRMADPPKAPPAPREGFEAGILLNDQGVKRLSAKEVTLWSKTTPVMFYSKQRKQILRPHLTDPVSKWEGVCDLGNATMLLSEMEVASGQPQSVVLVRVTPSQTYAKLRGYRLAKSLRDLILEQNDPKWWDEACQAWALRRFDQELSHSMMSYKPLAPILAECPNPNVRRLARVLSGDEEELSRQTGRRKRSLVEGSLKDPEVRRRFITELRKREWTLPAPRFCVFNGERDGKILSPRWHECVRQMHDIWYQRGDREDREIFVRAWMAAEIEAQSRGGR